MMMTTIPPEVARVESGVVANRWYRISSTVSIASTLIARVPLTQVFRSFLFSMVCDRRVNILSSIDDNGNVIFVFPIAASREKRILKDTTGIIRDCSVNLLVGVLVYRVVLQANNDKGSEALL
jgi:hypothetical protein